MTEAFDAAGRLHTCPGCGSREVEIVDLESEFRVVERRGFCRCCCAWIDPDTGFCWW